jgi:hypothetical protein
VALDDALAQVQLDVPLWELRHSGHVDGSAEVEVADAAQHLGVRTVFRHDRIVELLPLHPPMVSGGEGGARGSIGFVAHVRPMSAAGRAFRCVIDQEHNR